MLEKEAKWLDEKSSSGIQVKVANGQLKADPDGGAALPLARVNWTPNAVVNERLEPSLDTLSWPKLALVGSDVRSMRGLLSLEETVAPTAPSLVCRFQQASRSEIGWEDLVVDVIRYCESRCEDNAGRASRLDSIARMANVADQVTALIEFVRSGHSSALPNTLPENRDYVLIQTLAPWETRSIDKEDKVLIEQHYLGLQRSGLLVVALAGSTQQWYRVTVGVNGEETVFTRQGGQGAESLAPVSAGTPFSLAVQSTTTTPPSSVVAGLYNNPASC
jgi:hypothetical protein